MTEYNISIQDLFAAVVAWAKARNLIAGSDPKTQTLKTVSEFAEIGAGIFKEDIDEIKDGLGDTLVTVIIVAAQLGKDAYDAFETKISLESELGEDFEMYNYELASATLGLMADNVIKGQVNDYMINLAVFIQLLADIAESRSCSLHDCLAAAYDEIKDRKGVMYHGAFIKDSDPRYAGACAELGLEA
jgi:NTP pyrophosphatase (non-canonical NTP hydrolase)